MSLLAGDRQSEQARARRRMYPIHIYVGRNGSGKSLAAVYDTLPDLAAGLPCLSTVRLLDYENSRPCDNDDCADVNHGAAGHMAAHPGYVRFSRWEQLLKWSRGPVIMDEITGVADSMDAGLPGPVRDFLAQMRRADVSVRITGLNFIRVNKRIREAANAVTRCNSSLPYTIEDSDGHERMWRPRRLAKWQTYDSQSLPLDDHTEGAYAKADKICRGRHWIPTSPARLAYDTFAPVSTVGTVDDSGRCVHCGGSRRVPECGCTDYQAAKAGRAGGARRPLAAEHSARPAASTVAS